MEGNKKVSFHQNQNFDTYEKTFLIQIESLFQQCFRTGLQLMLLHVHKARMHLMNTFYSSNAKLNFSELFSSIPFLKPMKRKKKKKYFQRKSS